MQPILHLQHAVCPHHLATARARLPWCLLGVLALLLSASPAMAEVDQVSEGLSASDWAGIRAAYEAKRHDAFAVESGYVARNPGQQWRTHFDGRGFSTTPDASGWSWGLELVDFGRAGIQSRAHQQEVTDELRRDHDGAGFLPVCVQADGGRVEYQWGDTLTEWYINDRRGLEHGYTVHQRPDGFRVGASAPRGRSARAAAHGSLEGPLAFTLAVRGGLAPRVSTNGRNVTFVNEAGAPAVNYSGLTVFDATGAAVPAWFEAAGDNSPFGVSSCISVDQDPLATANLRLTGATSSVGRHRLRLMVDDWGAVYPLTIDPIAQQAYLKASNTGASDLFGRSVAVSGETVIVGAWSEDSSATGVNGNQADNSAGDSGAAYVFVRNISGEWSQQAYLKASNSGAGDRFGWTVAVNGDTVVIGAPNEDSNATGVNGNQANNSASDSGAAYVFFRSGTSWSQQAYLKASNTGVSDQYGYSVAADGETVLVGAPFEDSSATGVNGNQADNGTGDSGAVYVYARSGENWSQQAYVKASNTGASDQFGYSVAASDDTIVVGAQNEDSIATGIGGNQSDNNASNSGAAFIFIRNGGIWSQQAYVKASNTGAGDQFGWSVAADSDTVVVGAYLEDSSATGVDGNQFDNSAGDSGAAYVYVRNGGVWSQQAYIKASNTGASDLFGYSAAVDGDRLAIGARWEDSNATGIDGNQADNSAINSGAAYLFSRAGGVWSHHAYIKAANTGAGDVFGQSVAISGDTLVVGANDEDSNATGVNGNQTDNSASNSGAAYAFVITTPCPTTGDLNCDCTLDLLDMDALVLALLDPAGYAIAYPGCDILRGDMQPDGNVDGLDVRGFLSLLIP